MNGQAEIGMASDGWATYRVPHAIRQENAAEVRSRLLALIDCGAQQLRLDMTELEGVDSAGLTLIMSFLATLCQERPNAEVAFNGLSPQIMRLMGMVRVKDFGLRVTITGVPR